MTSTWQRRAEVRAIAKTKEISEEDTRQPILMLTETKTKGLPGIYEIVLGLIMKETKYTNEKMKENEDSEE